MAYFSSTEASTLVNVPHRVDFGGLSARSLGESTSQVEGRALWFYNSTSHTAQLNESTGYITDGQRLGMRNGDVLIAVESTGATPDADPPRLMIAVVSQVSSAGVVISTASMISSTAPQA